MDLEHYELSARAQTLLKLLIEHYIRDGQPVGSRTLSKAGVDLSPATIRNVMADLEEMGFVASPHTSAGRVPTALGYRFFVDSLLTVRRLESNEEERVRQEIRPGLDTKSLVETASELLSARTHFASVVTLPRREHETLRHVEFLPLPDNRVLVVMVVNQHEVENRIIEVERPYSERELQRAANYLNQEFAGLSLVEIREKLLSELHRTRETLNRLMLVAVEMADKAFVTSRAEDLLVRGQTNLMEYGELADIDRLRQLFEAFNEKRDILHLLDQSQRAQGVQLFIGEESGYEALEGCTVVAAPYGDDTEIRGVLGIIGPTRMAYERVIPLVDVTARAVGAALKPGS